MSVCFRAHYIYLYHNMTNTTGVISRFLFTSIQLCRVLIWMPRSWTGRWGCRRTGCHVQPPKPPFLSFLPLPSLLSSLPCCPPPQHISLKSATTPWWSTPARRNASLRKSSRATLSPLSIRHVALHLQIGIRIETSFSQVIDGGDEMTSELDINFKLLSPRGHPLVAEFKKSDGTHSHHIEVSGR